MKKFWSILFTLVLMLALTTNAYASIPPPVETDVFPDSEAVIMVELFDDGPGLLPVDDLRGPTTINVYLDSLGDPDTNGREQVDTEIVSMELVGSSPFGPVNLRLNPLKPPSVGLIEENVNNTPGVLDLPPFAASGQAESFFDVFFEIEIAAMPGSVYHNDIPARLGAIIDYKPPLPPTAYMGPLEPIVLLNEFGEPVGLMFWDMFIPGFIEPRIPQLELLPASDTNPPGTDHTVTAIYELDGFPLAGNTIEFEVTAGPNVGEKGSDVTDANGEATFTYTGDGGEGTDTIKATAPLASSQATKDWSGNGPGPPPQVPGITVWGILAAGIILAVLIPLALRRRKLSSTGS